MSAAGSECTEKFETSCRALKERVKRLQAVHDKFRGVVAEGESMPSTWSHAKPEHRRAFENFFSGWKPLPPSMSQLQRRAPARAAGDFGYRSSRRAATARNDTAPQVCLCIYFELSTRLSCWCCLLASRIAAYCTEFGRASSLCRLGQQAPAVGGPRVTTAPAPPCCAPAALLHTPLLPRLAQRAPTQPLWTPTPPPHPQCCSQSQHVDLPKD